MILIVNGVVIKNDRCGSRIINFKDAYFMSVFLGIGGMAHGVIAAVETVSAY